MRLVGRWQPESRLTIERPAPRSDVASTMLLFVVAGCPLIPLEAAAQGSARLERMMQVEIAALLCEVELPDDFEEGLDRGIRAEQRRLNLTERQMARIYEQVRGIITAQQEAAFDSLRQLDPSPDDPDEQ
jgi:hypothetical protein